MYWRSQYHFPHRLSEALPDLSHYVISERPDDRLEETSDVQNPPDKFAGGIKNHAALKTSALSVARLILSSCGKTPIPGPSGTLIVPSLSRSIGGSIRSSL